MPAVVDGLSWREARLFVPKGWGFKVTIIWYSDPVLAMSDLATEYNVPVNAVSFYDGQQPRFVVWK